MLRTSIVAAIALFVLRGCVPAERPASGELSDKEVARLAARLANDECEKFYKRRPFSPTTYKATFQKNRWHWGKFDPAGINGYSAEVLFRKDGSDPRVKVFFSSDVLTPREGEPEDKLRELTPPPERREKRIRPPGAPGLEFRQRR